MQQRLTRLPGMVRSFPFTVVHPHVCPPVSASLQRLLAQATYEVTAMTPSPPRALRCSPSCGQPS